MSSPALPIPFPFTNLEPIKLLTELSTRNMVFKVCSSEVAILMHQKKSGFDLLVDHFFTTATSAKEREAGGGVGPWCQVLKGDPKGSQSCVVWLCYWGALVQGPIEPALRARTSGPAEALAAYVLHLPMPSQMPGLRAFTY